MKHAGIGRSYDFNVGPHVLAIEHHIFAAPTNLIKKREFERSADVSERKSIKKFTQQFPRRSLELSGNPTGTGRSFRSRNPARSRCPSISPADLFPKAAPCLVAYIQRGDYTN